MAVYRRFVLLSAAAPDMLLVGASVPSTGTPWHVDCLPYHAGSYVFNVGIVSWKPRSSDFQRSTATAFPNAVGRQTTPTSRTSGSRAVHTLVHGRSGNMYGCSVRPDYELPRLVCSVASYDRHGCFLQHGVYRRSGVYLSLASMWHTCTHYVCVAHSM